MDIKCEIDIKTEPLEGEEYNETKDQIYVMTGLQGIQNENFDPVADTENEFELKKEPLDIQMEESKNEDPHVIDDTFKGKRSSESSNEEFIEKERMTVQDDYKEFSCLNCNFIFENEDELGSHLESSCKGIVKCSRCISDCNCELNLNNRNTDERKLFRCSECSYECNQKQYLKIHMLKHENIKLFKCSECNYECNQNKYLKVHMLAHRKVKLFKCTECSYESNRKEHLKAHILKHLNIKLFKCSECNYACNQKKYLKVHLLGHKNIKLFKCTECDHECNDKGNLKKHLLIHEKVKLFKCSKCNYECNRKENLKRHLLKHGNIDSTGHSK